MWDESRVRYPAGPACPACAIRANGGRVCLPLPVLAGRLSSTRMDTGEFPGFEFEVPRGPGYGPRHTVGPDPPRDLRTPPRPAAANAPRPAREVPRGAPEPVWDRPVWDRPVRVPSARAESARGVRPSAVVTAGRGVLAVIRGRNWLLGLAAPLVAAIAVGIAVVVVTGGSGGGGAAPPDLAAGFPPARLAGPEFTGTGASAARVTLSAVGASGGTEVAAGGADGVPALWVSADGGTSWARAALGGASATVKDGQLAGVAHGASGWLAVGTTAAAGADGPLLASSADGRRWTVTGTVGGQRSGDVVAAVAAGGSGYVVVGHQPAGSDGADVAAAWYAAGLTGWKPATLSGPSGSGRQQAGQTMNGVTATAGGFTAVGASGPRPAVWRSATGQSWSQVTLAMPAGAERAALEYAAGSGRQLVAAGTEFTAAGASRPFAEVSADAGRTWTEVQLPVPAIGPGTGTTVTALTAAGGGFTAAGTYVTAAGPEVVVWTLPPGSPAAAGASWSAGTPQGAGLAGTGSENAITALAANGATLAGVGFTAATGSGSPGAQQPTLWQSPVRY